MAEVVNYKDIGFDMERLITDFDEATSNTTDITWRRKQRKIMIKELNGQGDRIIAEAVAEYSAANNDFDAILQSLSDFEEKLKQIADTVEKATKVLGWLTKLAKYAGYVL